MIQIVIYLIPVIAFIALLWSNRNWIKNLFEKKKTSVATNEYNNVMANKAVQFALKWKNGNHGRKQNETAFRDNGKFISQSMSYKSIQESIFDTN